MHALTPSCLRTIPTRLRPILTGLHASRSWAAGRMPARKAVTAGLAAMALGGGLAWMAPAGATAGPAAATAPAAIAAQPAPAHRPPAAHRPASPVMTSSAQVRAAAGARATARLLAARRALATPAWRAYTVQPGDSLSLIASRIYGVAADWTIIYQANRSQISDPGLIYPGQVLRIPALPQLRAPAPPAHQSTASRARTRAANQIKHRGGAKHRAAASLTAVNVRGGTLGCAALEALWEQAGGAPREAVVAASIAMAESSGQQYATGAAGERGYWQINPDHGALSTYDPYGNARAAVMLSGNGTNWSPWTTYTTGLYLGRC